MLTPDKFESPWFRRFLDGTGCFEDINELQRKQPALEISRISFTQLYVLVHRNIYRDPNILSICSLDIFVWIHNSILRQVSWISRSQQRWKTYRII